MTVSTETLSAIDLPKSWTGILCASILQVSETENLRKNLAIERMIVSGCDILLDVNQVYVREGKTLF